MYDENAISDEFAALSHGYLAADIPTLQAIRNALPRPGTKREWAIRDAIDAGLASPSMWLRIQTPMQFKRRPEEDGEPRRQARGR